MSSTELQELEKKRRGSQSSSSTSHSSAKEKIEVEINPETDDPEVRFIQSNHNVSDVRLEVGAPKIEFTGLTKDELMKFANDPFWRKVRWVLFILFWVLWAGMLVAAILIIVLTPKCPVIPKQTFWQKSPGYHVDIATFKDSNGDGVGDVKGVAEKIDYLKTKCGFLILSSLIEGSLGTPDVRSTAVTDFQNVDSRVGTMDDVKMFLKKCRQNGIKTLIDFPIHTGKKHEWFIKAENGDTGFQKYYIWSSSKKTSKFVNRIGDDVWNKAAKSGYYWSSLHESVPALNLDNEDVMKNLSGAVQFWLKQGFDGIFIDNTAFLKPNVSTTSIGEGLSGITDGGKLASWYKTGHTGQLYTSGSVEFIQTVRGWVDEVKKQTDRERMLLVSTGNTGIKQDTSKSIAYLGDAVIPGAHSVMVYELVPGQGQKVKSTKNQPLKDSVISIIALNQSVTTITQTMSGPRHGNFITTCLNLLIPTTAVSLYGEEISMEGYRTVSEAKAYLNLPYWYITQAALKKEAFKNDLVDSYDVPMQWTYDGGFTTKNTSLGMVFPDANVMRQNSIGIGQTKLNVFDKIIELRKEHSFSWGALKWIESANMPELFIFTREAKGFKKYIVVMVEKKTVNRISGRAIDISNVCEKAVNVVNFPADNDFKENVSLSMKSIYIRYTSIGSLYIFKCD